MDNNNAYTSYENVSNTAKSDQELASNSSKNMNIANLSNDLPSSNINEPVDKSKVAPRIDMKPSSIKSVPQKQIGPEVQANLLITIHVFSCILIFFKSSVRLYKPGNQVPEAL